MKVQTKVDAPTPHDRDPHAWAQEQARPLRKGNVAALDLVDLLDEIEDMAGALERELGNRIGILIEHLLKDEYGLIRDPARGLKRTIVEQRLRIAKPLRKNPSLPRLVVETVAGEYEDARKIALARIAEYRTASPADLPCSAEQVLDEDWLPESGIRERSSQA